MSATLKSVRFVEARELFEDCPLAWREFVLREKAAFEGNHITLVKASYVYSVLTDAKKDAYHSHLNRNQYIELWNQTEIVFRRMLNSSVGGNFYINLGN